MTVDDRAKAYVVREFVAGRQQTQIAIECGINQSRVCLWIREFCDQWSGADVSRIGAYNEARKHYAVRALCNWFIKTGGDPVHPMSLAFDLADKGYWRARREHAWLLRSEGLTYERIGDRLGVCSGRANQMVHQFSERVSRAIKRTKFEVHHDHPPT